MSLEVSRDVKEVLKPFIVKTDVVKPNREVFVVDAKNIREVMNALRKAYDGGIYFATIVAVDKQKENIFELNYFIHIIYLGKTIVIRTAVPRGSPRIDTVVDIFPGAFEAEAEVYDLFGVEFVGNNYLKRGFFVPADVVAKNIYPLRKDAPV